MAKKKAKKKAAPAKVVKKKAVGKKPVKKQAATKKPTGRSGKKAATKTPSARRGRPTIVPPVLRPQKFDDIAIYGFLVTVPTEPDTAKTSFAPTVNDQPYGKFDLVSQKKQQVADGWELDIHATYAGSLAAAKRGKAPGTKGPLASGKLTITIKSVPSVTRAVEETTFEYKRVIYRSGTLTTDSFGATASGKLTKTIK